MNKLLPLPIILTVCTVFVHAQSVTESTSPPQTKIIRWKGVNAPKDCCNNYYENNRLITNYRDENIFFTIGVDVETEKKFLAIVITILNKSNNALTVYPENFTMRLTAPQNKTYNSLSVEEVAKKIENRGKWRMLAAQIAAGMATNKSTAVVTDNYGNRADITVTERDRETQRRTNENVRQQRAENEDRADVIRAISLPRHTLFKDKIIGGVVFFKKENLTAGMIISFTLGDTTYEIPYGTERAP